MMKIELHIIQNFAPSCLNRDDVNAPKDCEFGGARRARISSQCLKRSIRNYWTANGLLENERASRTRKILSIVAAKLVEKGRDIEESKLIAKYVLEAACGFAVKKDDTIEYLLFISEKATSRMSELIDKNWDELSALAAKAAQDEESKTKKTKSKVIPKELSGLFKELGESLFDSSRAADLAMFGRMIADRPDQNVDASCQVAHALSTHRVSMEVDYYTAVDDLQEQEETGAAMIGVIEFNSACFYRYSLVDMDDLKNNLGNDSELATNALKAYIKAAILAIPTGKQNSMAAHNLPSFVLAVVRNGGTPWSLANAFEVPVNANISKNGGLVAQSVSRLDDYYGKMKKIYGNSSISFEGVLALEDYSMENLEPNATSIDEFVEKIVNQITED